MKDLDKLLKYQELDIKLRRAQDVIERSDEYKKMEQARQEFAQTKKTRDESEKAAEGIVGFVGSAEDYIKEISAKMEELKGDLDSDDPAKAAAAFAQLNKLKGKLSDLEHKLAERKSKSERAIKTFVEAGELGRKLRDYYNAARQKHMELVKAKQPEINAINKQLAELKPTIDKDLMQRYETLTADNKYPAFVEVYGEGGYYSCRGCGLALSQSKTSELKEKSFCVCDTCKRIIFKK